MNSWDTAAAPKYIPAMHTVLKIMILRPLIPALWEAHRCEQVTQSHPAGTVFAFPPKKLKGPPPIGQTRYPHEFVKMTTIQPYIKGRFD